MREKQEIPFIPEEIILKFFLPDAPTVNQVLAFMFLSKRWYEIARKNSIWKSLFIERFSYDPTSYKWDHNFDSFSFFKSYRKQLVITQELKEKYKDECISTEKLGLKKAIEEKNIPFIYSLLCSYRWHELNIGLLFASDSSNNLLKDILNFVSLCADLPHPLFLQLMERCVYKTNIGKTPLLNLIVCHADPELLRTVFKALGGKLLLNNNHGEDDIIFLSDSSRNGFIEVLLNPSAPFHLFFGFHPSLERFNIVMEILKETIGKTNLNELVVGLERYFDTACILRIIQDNKHDYFSVMLNCIGKQHNDFFLEKRDRDDALYEFTLVEILALLGDRLLFSHLLAQWDEDMSYFLIKYRSRHGWSLLPFALLNPDSSVLTFIRETIGDNFRDLLLEEGKDILIINDLSALRRGLQLLRDYNLLYIAREDYMSGDFATRITNCPRIVSIQEYDDLFNEFGIEKTTIYNSCNIL